MKSINLRKDKFLFGNSEIQAQLNVIVVDDTPVSITPRTMEVLLYLIDNRERVVSIDELLAAFWVGRIVEESTIHRIISNIRHALGDSSKQSNYIKTVSKRGYQAIAMVENIDQNAMKEDSARALSENNEPLGDDLAEANTGINTKLSKKSFLAQFAAMALIFLLSLIVIFALYSYNTESSDPILDKDLDASKSIAVLPFTNLDEQEQMDGFSKGLVDAILDELAQIENLKVASRTSSSLLHNQNLSIETIGRKLKVNYVMEGSVQELGGKIRVIAQLIRVEDEFHVLSRTYTEPLDHNFTTASEISKHLARNAFNKLMIDLKRLHPQYFPEFHGVNPEAVELYIQSMEQYSDAINGEGGNKLVAMQLVERAVNIDPNFLEAQLDLAWNYIFRINPELTAEESSQRAHAAIELVLAKDPGSIIAQFFLVQTYLYLDLNYALADAICKKAIVHNPDARWWRAFIAGIESVEGRLESALHYLQMEHAQGDNANNPEFIHIFAQANYANERYQEALKIVDEGLNLIHQGKPRSRLLLIKANTLIKLNRLNEAKMLVDEVAITGSDAIEELALTLVKLGESDKARKALDVAVVTPNNRAFFVLTYHALGESELAFEYLKSGIQVRDSSVIVIMRSNELSRDFRIDKRFTELLTLLESKETHTDRYYNDTN
jgi:adenylate cyclase